MGVCRRGSVPISSTIMPFPMSVTRYMAKKSTKREVSASFPSARPRRMNSATELRFCSSIFHAREAAVAELTEEEEGEEEGQQSYQVNNKNFAEMLLRK